MVILDLVIPRKTGIAILKEIRAQEKSVPVIVLSGKEDIPQKLESFKAGADDYVTKPFSFQELLARIHSLNKRPYTIKSSIYQIDDVTIDSDKQEVTRKGKSLYLTRKEFMLLECIVKEKGKVLSRGSLMEYVWDIDVDPFSNTLETHILNLRKKIGKNGKRIIKTVTGRGYRLGV